ncbi:MAG TPA: transcriptional repressor [Bacteroidales bacterium]|nr:transcriptional repressor [Bacteroidales bacterium]HCI56113.1 transcriptional repressor [Bacteroidales bacterium]HOU96690.1 transcriptional repressor [Bacteroidales bacterium]HQG37087.1 transcriptional repressor [Bacteroidales bacterium]HQG52432.1 transcriptional repressor [Bacteroidales bacterium]
MATRDVINILLNHNLKVTPQRIAILEVLMDMKSHPTAEEIYELLNKNHPNISMTTVYNTLRIFVQKGIIKKVFTGDDKIRYDSGQMKHHHIYYTDSEKIEDFFDDELDKMLKNYFSEKKIPGIIINDMSLQISGKSTIETSNKTKK